MGVLWFASGSFTTFAVASGLAVYKAEYVEHAWGKGGSFQVLCVLASIATVLLTIGFGMGAAIFKHFPRRQVCAALGAGASLAFVFFMWLLSAAHASPAVSWFAVLTLPFIGGVMPAFGGRDG